VTFAFFTLELLSLKMDVHHRCIELIKSFSEPFFLCSSGANF